MPCGGGSGGGDGDRGLRQLRKQPPNKSMQRSRPPMIERPAISGTCPFAVDPSLSFSGLACLIAGVNKGSPGGRVVAGLIDGVDLMIDVMKSGAPSGWPRQPAVGGVVYLMVSAASDGDMKE
jgi:hypothetical protein